MIKEEYNEIISGIVGILIISGIIMLIPIIPLVVYSEYAQLPFFLFPSTILLILGGYFYRKYPLPEDITMKSAIVIASIAWILISLIGTVPYLSIGMNVIDGFFESMSGFTTTGMTLISVLEICPRSILFWRSLSEWIGGIGIIFLFTILLKGSIGTWKLYRIEGREKFTLSVKESIRNIMIIYTTLTIVCTILLYLSGLDVFDSINHAMTTISTGGFSTKTDSITNFNTLTKTIIIMFMIIGAIDFALINEIIKLKIKKVISDPEFKAFIFIITISILLVYILNSKEMSFSINELFNTISIVTTTGYTSGDILLWPNSTKVLLLILMTIGGCANSTAGGIKVWRLLILFKLLRRELKRLLLPPSIIMPIKIGDKTFDDEYLIRICAFFFSYIVLIFIIFLLLSINVPDTFGAFSLAISSINNIGPAYYPIDKLDLFSKIILIISMWMGRLELFPVMAFIFDFIPETFKNILSRRFRKEHEHT